MLKEIQAKLHPYLGLVGENKWLQALLVMVCCFVIAWIFDRFISSFLRNLAGRTRHKIDDHLINSLHSPIYASVLLLGMALSVNLLLIPYPFDSIVFSSLQSLSLIHI